MHLRFHLRKTEEVCGIFLYKCTHHGMEMVAWDAPWSHLLLQCVRFFYFRVTVVPRGLFLVHTTYISGVLVRLR